MGGAAMTTPRRWIAAALALLVGLVSSPGAQAAEPRAFARVVVDTLELRTGPGISYRVVRTAHRGETFAVEGRPSEGFWIHVLLDDGRDAYVVGDGVETFAVVGAGEGGDLGTTGGVPRRSLFAPPPLEGSRGGFALVGGVLVTPTPGVVQGREGNGYLEVRPALVLHRSVTLEGFVGLSPTPEGSQLLYGAATQIHLAPSWPVCPFVGLGAGGYSVFPSADSFLLRREDRLLARGGGGLLFAFRNRILVRIEATHAVLFGADVYRTAQTYAGGLGVYF